MENLELVIIDTNVASAKTSIGSSNPAGYDTYGNCEHGDRYSGAVYVDNSNIKPQDGSVIQKVAPMMKTIYSPFPLGGLLHTSNRRYLEMISSWDDPSDGAKKLEELSESKKENDRPFKGFNFFSRKDQQLFRVLSHGEFNINGLQNKSIHKLLPELSPASVSRIQPRASGEPEYF